jgi:hypothetical protein
VVGTEVTVFEPLATQFAEEFYAHWLDDTQPIGEAIRRARLRLLAAGNPLGLVYISYTAPYLRLAPTHAWETEAATPGQESAAHPL